MDRAQIMDDLDDIQRKVDAMGFRGGNEYDLTVREEIADYITKHFKPKQCYDNCFAPGCICGEK
jgi:hypothetical protein